MDWLDCDLHSSILSSLATNLASTSSQDNLDLLESSFNSITPAPVTNGTISNLLSRLGSESSSAEDGLQSISLEQVNAISAYADFAAAEREPKAERLDRLLELARALPLADIEPALGLQSAYDYAPSDRLAFALVSSSLALTSSRVGNRSQTLKALVQLQRDLLAQIGAASGHRIISHLLPALNGTRRALSSHSFAWTLDDPAPSTPTLAPELLTRVYEAIQTPWDQSTLAGRTSLAVLSQYESALKGLEPGLIPVSVAESLLSYLASGIGGWDEILNGTPLVGEGKDEVKEFGTQAVASWRQTLAMLESDEKGAVRDPYAFELLLLNLKVATTASIAAGAPDVQVIDILEAVVSEASPVTDEVVQAGAIECLQAIAHAFKPLVARLTAGLRRFILSPIPLFEQRAELDRPPLLLAAGTAYASMLKLTADSAIQQSAIQSLFNHFNTGVDDQLNQANRSLVSVSIVHAVGVLALESHEEPTANLVASMLLQRLKVRDEAVEGAILYELSLLAVEVDKLTFLDIVRAVGEASKSPNLVEASSNAILASLTRLASVAVGRGNLHGKYIAEMLTLFIDKGTRSAGAGAERTARTNGLLELIPVLDAFLSSDSVDVRSQAQPHLVSLFRSFWYLCVLSGFTNTPSRIASWQREALVRIARASPGLLDGIGDDFVETELEYNTVLKHSGYPIGPDALKNELSGSVPQQAGLIRTLSPAQVTFLAAIFRIESFRAEAGEPAAMMSYFHNEGVNHTQLGAVLGSVAERVGACFIGTFNHLVTTHSIDGEVYKQVRQLLLECCHPLARTREVAMRYLNSFLVSFPSLVCDIQVVTTLLELLTVVRRACLAEFTDEYTPVWTFTSGRGKFAVTLADDYHARNKILQDLHEHAKLWLKGSLSRAPLEMRGILQEYIDGLSSDAQTQADDEMGKSVALDLIRAPPATGKQAGLPAWGGWRADQSAEFARTFAAKSFYGGEASRATGSSREQLLAELVDLSEQVGAHKVHKKRADLRALFYRSAAYLINAAEPCADVLHHVVALPVRMLTEATATVGQEVWTWIAEARPELESRLVCELSSAWLHTIEHRQGLFSTALNRIDPLNQETQYTPTDKAEMSQHAALVTRLLQPHSILLAFISSRFQAFRYRDRDLVMSCARIVLRSTEAVDRWCSHQLARELRMRLLSFGFCVVQASRLEAAVEFNLRKALYNATLAWFALRAGWSYGSNKIQLRADLQAVEELYSTIKSDQPSSAFTLSPSGSTLLPGKLALGLAINEHQARQKLMLALLENEADRLKVWINPLMDSGRGPVPSSRQTNEASWKQLVKTAWQLNPEVAVHLVERTKLNSVAADVTKLVRADPARVQHVPEALQFFIGDSITPDVRPKLKHLLYWAPVPVVSALRFVFPKFKGDPILLQYALRVLEHHPVEVTFFYIPQVVQALRNDALGYAERFIFETSKISQLFCHQIIWNMKANMYRGDDGEVADPMKPALERMVSMIVGSLDGEAKEFYEREFGFFDEVTSISAKLKPLVGKATKAEKKQKIDEEMAKIVVDPGVYLPSNPDGVLVDIDRLSGRPLQSHAKAPFMATFKVRRERKSHGQLTDEDAMLDQEDGGADSATSGTFDTWQSAIFKVGDDCRQDVLALQIIAMHKNIFTSLGLDLLVTPYRVTATGAGCGVIDVVPNATSRDEMGRAKVNDLRSFFVLKYGSAEGVDFQRARTHFIQSMAAYSLLCYIVQIKDRHNGNIMIDGRGCITHIDFGFLFDIGPGGVKFEPSSFKLTHEMIVLIGGRDSPGFRQFEELTVKAFLAARPYGQQVVDTSSLMLAAEFPSFKGEPTMDRLRERFRLDLTEVQAAEYMRGVIANACENPRSIVYDEFQRITNGIPYVR